MHYLAWFARCDLLRCLLSDKAVLLGTIFKFSVNLVMLCIPLLMNTGNVLGTLFDYVCWQNVLF